MTLSTYLTCLQHLMCFAALGLSLSMLAISEIVKRKAQSCVVVQLLEVFFFSSSKIATVKLAVQC